jgi:hypothetical protein
MARGAGGLRTRHVVGISVGGVLVAFGVAIWVMLASMRSADAVDARRAVAMGTIGRTGLGDEHDVAEVVWRDGRGMSHTARFRFYYPDDWQEGEAFGVSYDTADPGGPVFAAGGYADYIHDGRLPSWLRVVPPVAIFVAFASSWLVRGGLNLRARSAPTSEWHARVLVDTERRVVNGILVSLDPADGTVAPKDRYWQRVLWSPALAELAEGRTVRARIRHGLRGRAVIEAPDGSLIWPAGRLRTSPALTPLDWPPSWRLDRPRVGPLMTVLFLAIPFVAVIQVDHSVDALETMDPGFVALAACVYGLYFHIWGWAGGVFARVPPSRL